MRPELVDWAAGGDHYRSVPFGHRVFYRDIGDSQADADDTLLLIHGFPESSFSFHKVVAGLAAKFKRVVLLDLIGFGLSDKPQDRYSYSLFEQADIALQLWRHMGIRGGHLLAHDMGDSVATELVARHVSGLLPAQFDRGFRSFTFTNGSMVLSLASLRLTQKLLLTRFAPLLSRLANYRTFRQQVHSAHGPDTLSEDDVSLMWDNALQQDGHLKNHLLFLYLRDRMRFEQTRWLPALAQVREPVHLCWGEADAVARVEMAHYLKQQVCTDARVTLMPGVGHFCQISDPEIWVQSVTAFYQ